MLSWLTRGLAPAPGVSIPLGTDPGTRSPSPGPFPAGRWVRCQRSGGGGRAPPAPHPGWERRARLGQRCLLRVSRVCAGKAAGVTEPGHDKLGTVCLLPPWLSPERGISLGLEAAPAELCQ